MQIKGSIVAMVTPFNEDHSIDYKSLEKLISIQIKNQTSAIIVAGTTGESATLSVEEHIELSKFVIKKVAGKIPVGVGTGANSTKEAVHLHQEAKKMGADFALSVAPYYNRPSQEGIFKHFEEIVKKVDLPTIIYNVPGRTASDIENTTALKIAKLPNIIGIKDATGNLYRNQELILYRPKSFAIYSGDDLTSLPFMLCGGDGVISVSANIRPKEVSLMCKAALDKKLKKSRQINSKLLKLHKALMLANPAAIKYALSKEGLIKNVLRLPLIQIDEKNKHIIDEALEQSK